ncbi:E3 ubiquitin ligase family protein [Halomarina litorea]|uniref:E3 ubiquitin ligase family protein n=1 Tax=Halomarina litorea TaxID=2961595 RepID=UPI0020C4E867|nr:E3 ubiquitin ligase family protein [Halomarina sp. BCD28]
MVPLPLQTFGLLFVGVFALVGLALVAYAGRDLFVAYRLSRMDPTPVADLPNVSGPVEIEGRALVHEETFESPFTGTPCLACEWRVEEERHDDDGTHWVTVASGSEAVPFRVEDDTANVLVYPAGVDLRLANESPIRVDGGKRPPERIQRFIDSNGDVGPEDTSFDIGPLSITTGDDRRYYESRLDPDEPVYVYGTPVYSPGVGDAVGQVNATMEPGDGRFIVSDTTDSGVVRWFVRSALIPLVIGVLFVGFALFFGFSLGWVNGLPGL